MSKGSPERNFMELGSPSARSMPSSSSGESLSDFDPSIMGEAPLPPAGLESWEVKFFEDFYKNIEAKFNHGAPKQNISISIPLQEGVSLKQAQECFERLQRLKKNSKWKDPKETEDPVKIARIQRNKEENGELKFSFNPETQPLTINFDMINIPNRLATPDQSIQKGYERDKRGYNLSSAVIDHSSSTESLSSPPQSPQLPQFPLVFEDGDGCQKGTPRRFRSYSVKPDELGSLGGSFAQAELARRRSFDGVKERS